MTSSELSRWAWPFMMVARLTPTASEVMQPARIRAKQQQQVAGENQKPISSFYVAAAFIVCVWCLIAVLFFQYAGFFLTSLTAEIKNVLT